jgi:hypothetical protein
MSWTLFIVILRTIESFATSGSLYVNFGPVKARNRRSLNYQGTNDNRRVRRRLMSMDPGTMKDVNAAVRATSIASYSFEYNVPDRPARGDQSRFHAPPDFARKRRTRRAKPPCYFTVATRSALVVPE